MTVSCPRTLVRLLGTCPGVSGVIPEGTIPTDFACQAPLMKLPRIFGTAVDTIPSQVPYLAADPGFIAQWRDEPVGGDGFQVRDCLAG